MVAEQCNAPGAMEDLPEVPPSSRDSDGGQPARRGAPSPGDDEVDSEGLREFLRLRATQNPVVVVAPLVRVMALLTELQMTGLIVDLPLNGMVSPARFRTMPSRLVFGWPPPRLNQGHVVLC